MPSAITTFNTFCSGSDRRQRSPMFGAWLNLGGFESHQPKSSVGSYLFISQESSRYDNTCASGLTHTNVERLPEAAKSVASSHFPWDALVTISNHRYMCCFSYVITDLRGSKLSACKWRKSKDSVPKRAGRWAWKTLTLLDVCHLNRHHGKKGVHLSWIFSRR